MTEPVVSGLTELLDKEEVREFPVLSEGIPILMGRCKYIILDLSFLLEGIRGFNVGNVSGIGDSSLNLMGLSELYKRHQRTGNGIDLDSLEREVRISIQSTNVKLRVLEQAFRSSEVYEEVEGKVSRNGGFYVVEDTYDSAEEIYKDSRRDLNFQRRIGLPVSKRGRKIKRYNRTRKSNEPGERKAKMELRNEKFAKINQDLTNSFRENLDVFSTLLSYFFNSQGILPVDSSYPIVDNTGAKHFYERLIETALGFDENVGIITISRIMGQKIRYVKELKSGEIETPKLLF